MRLFPFNRRTRRFVRPLLVEQLEGRVVPSFLAARAFDAGSGPQSVATGDFNGDGALDLAVANNDSSNVSVLPGTGDGAFGAARNFSAGSGPQSVATGDFNGDGALDLAVANAGSNNVSVLLGTGDGAFGAARNFSAGSSPLSVATGYFNGDGALDLAVANANSNNVSVLLGTGDGAFGAARNFSAGSRPFSVATGDFNGDGVPDLAVANFSSNNVSVLLGTGDGAFGAARNFSAGSNPRSVATGDFNGDGALDLAVANSANLGGTPNVSVLLGTGDGTFGAARNFAAGIRPSSVAVGDFNGDGALDLAVANSGSNNVSVLLGTGDGAFGAARNFSAGSSPSSVATGDFNGDGALDLAVANTSSNNVSVLLGSGDGAFGAARNFAAGFQPLSVAVGDFNGDGALDLVVTSGTVRVLLGNGDGTLQTTHVSYVAGNGPGGLGVADLDGDGWLDAVTANNGSRDVSILLNAADDAAIFFLDAPAQVTAGQPFDLTVYAFSGTGLLAHGYHGTVAFWTTDEAATVPEPYRFRPEDYGSVSFQGGVTLRTPGVQELYAFDLETFTIIGYATIEVLGSGSPGGGGTPGPVLDLFAGQELVRTLVHQSAVPEAGPAAGPGQTGAVTVPGDGYQPVLHTTGTSPAARLGRGGALLDQLFGKLDGPWFELDAHSQIAGMLASNGKMIIHPVPARFFEVPIQGPLPEDLNYLP